MLKEYKFHRVDKEKDVDEWEEVLPERWCWEAYYHDDTVLKQFDDESGMFHQVGEIDQSKLNCFRMINYGTGKFHDLYFTPEMKLIHFYNAGRQFIFTNKEQTEGYNFYYKNYAFGFKKVVNGQAIEFINFILPDDNVITADNRKMTVNFS